MEKPKLSKNNKFVIILAAAVAAVILVLLFAVLDVAGLRQPVEPPPPPPADETVLQERVMARFIHMSDNEIIYELGKPNSIEEGDHIVFATGDTYPYKRLEFKDDDLFTYSFTFIDGELNNFHVSTWGTSGIPFSGDPAAFLASLGFETDPSMTVILNVDGTTLLENVNDDIEYITIDISEEEDFVYNMFFMLNSAKF